MVPGVEFSGGSVHCGQYGTGEEPICERVETDEEEEIGVEDHSVEDAGTQLEVCRASI